MPEETLDAELISDRQPTREALVWQRNQISNARYKLSPRAQKLLLYTIAMIDPEAEEFGLMKISVQDYAELTGLEAKHLYHDLRETAVEIRRAPLVIDKLIEPGKKQPVRRDTSWFEYVDQPEGDGYITVKLISWLKPYLLQVRRDFFRFQLGFALDLRSEYSIRLYQLAKRWEFAKRKTFPVDQLRLELGATEVDRDGKITRINLEQYKHFKARAIVSAVAEINAETDLLISFKEEKHPGKKTVKAITFDFATNTANLHKLRKIKLPARAQMEFALTPPPAPPVSLDEATKAKLAELGKEFGVSTAQQTALQAYALRDGLEYLLEKAEIVRSQPRDNAARAFFAALKGDWQMPVKVPAKPAKKGPPKKQPEPDPPGWRQWVRRNYPTAEVPSSFQELKRIASSVAKEFLEDGRLEDSPASPAATIPWEEVKAKILSAG